MPIELECKICVEAHEPIREKVRAAGGRLVKRVLEVNRIFDDARRSLRDRGCGLRVRSVTVLEGQAKAAAVLTLKGPVQAGILKRREETEVRLDDADTMAAILKALGYEPGLIFEKRRETWELGGCLVDLDELPRLGRFIEVEGPDDAAICSCLMELGLAESGHVAESYAQLVSRNVPADSSGVVELRF